MMFLKKPAIRCALWLLVIAIAVMIFAFSAQGSKDSQQTSSRLTKPVMTVISTVVPKVTPARKKVLSLKVEFIIRKLAHFTEFAMLGISLALLLLSYERKQPWFTSWFLTTLYACTDELHQFLAAAGRSASWKDVCIDSCGAAVGITILWFLIHKHLKEHANG